MEPENYSYWLRSSAKAVIPQKRDWSGVGHEVFNAIHYLWYAICVTVFRLLLLLTFPVSVPLLALALTRLNKRAVSRHNQRREEMLADLTRLNQQAAQAKGED